MKIVILFLYSKCVDIYQINCKYNFTNGYDFENCRIELHAIDIEFSYLNKYCKNSQK